MNTVTVEIFRNENGVSTGREGGGRTFLFLYNFFTIEIYMMEQTKNLSLKTKLGFRENELISGLHHDHRPHGRR